MPERASIAAGDKASAREIVKETLTPQRLFLLSWAFAAIFFGCVGLAAYHFGPYTETVRYAGVPLPPSGPVNVTGSIAQDASSIQVDVLPSRNGQIITADNQMTDGQIETLQREVVGLRRRLSMLSEQNLSYSRRIAALEARLGANQTDLVSNDVGENPPPSEAALKSKTDIPLKPMPEIGVPTTPLASTTAAAPHSDMLTDKPPAHIESREPRAAKPIEVLPAPETQKPAVSATHKQAEKRVERETSVQPVRIVQLPSAEDPPTATGSLPSDAMTEFDELDPILVTPSEPSGRTSGPGKTDVSRTDFGAVVGRYASPEAAAKAWKTFIEQNEERMQGLRPILAPSAMLDGEIDLLIGPFANAADAAVACLKLLQIIETCHPALFVGEDLPMLAQVAE